MNGLKGPHVNMAVEFKTKVQYVSSVFSLKGATVSGFVLFFTLKFVLFLSIVSIKREFRC